jgi:hypothetical protein
MNLLGDSTDNTNKCTATSIDVSKEVGLKINVKKPTKHMFVVSSHECR